MIEISHLSKSFDNIKAVNDVSVTIHDGNVFGLIGTNGAGKSTVLRMMTGIIKPDNGVITIDTLPIFDNTEAKSKLFFIADEPYFFSNSTPKELQKYYSSIFPAFHTEHYYQYLEKFELSQKRKLNTFSKGMKKQLALLCGICSNTKYLICDETFDGLDPVMRQGIKSIFAQEMADRGLTPIIASHNLRELEDICDHIGLLHRGGVLLSKDLEDMKCNIQKVQYVLQSPADEAAASQGLEILKLEKRGSLNTLTVRGTRENITKHFEDIPTIFFETLPLSLEEIFISETEVVGYDIQKLILN